MERPFASILASSSTPTGSHSRSATSSHWTTWPKNTGVNTIASSSGSRRFRPYALSIAEEDAHRVLDLPHMARWMQMVCKVQDDVRERIPSAQHIDGTTRPQVCQASANPRYHALLRAHAENAQTPGLLNTSFNERGYPIVASRNDALLMFARTPMDTLVVDNVLVRKV